ncbi:3-isopropylmalate dehydratase small subunit [Granulosicoccus antarcticus]|uniref:3-isopropylmalate dehydratase small subunit n=1 Tax=Granulosicoccus antarcticus IMCC3135 TaxID=1192854 RepID=A0A2Z2P215_9GAMM|nr:3-isopropylmalate dehydratase small subunit [Granulosicoccus antarcticus]ASJ75340.1 3-isopropylmalate dehydratase small subunit 1 [Granulosicoccus antarcticus IMCC3135]
MQSFTKMKGLAVPLMRSNVDTDAIIPKQFLKSIKRSGFGVNLFDEWRYKDAGFPGQDSSTRQPNPDFVLNKPRYKGAQVLIAGENFGCGSSREHAVWALGDYGFRTVIASGFADIFNNNSFKSGLLPIVLDKEITAKLAEECESSEGYELDIDLEAQTVTTPNGDVYPFEVDSFRKHCLLNGFDDIELTLQQRFRIEEYEVARRKAAPWLFDSP